MTYNFDPDRWYDMELRALKHKALTGELSAQALEKEMADLQKRYEEMIERLDGTYQLPGGNPCV